MQADWIASDWFKAKKGHITARIVIESERGTIAFATCMDQPVSFSPIHRMYTLRGLKKEAHVMLGTVEHDPMAVL